MLQHSPRLLSAKNATLGDVLPVLSHTLGGAAEAAKAVQECPDLLSSRPEDIYGVFNALVRAFGGVGAARRAAALCPALLRESGTSVARRVEALEGVLGGTERAERALQLRPSSLAQSVQNICNTWSALRRALVGDEELTAQVMFVAVCNPALLRVPGRQLAKAVGATVEALGSKRAAAAALQTEPSLMLGDAAHMQHAMASLVARHDGEAPRTAAERWVQQHPVLLMSKPHVLEPDAMHALGLLYGDTAATLAALAHNPGILRCPRGHLEAGIGALVEALGGSGAARGVVEKDAKVLGLKRSGIEGVVHALEKVLGDAEAAVDAMLLNSGRTWDRWWQRWGAPRRH
eukprot:gene32381-41047_t